MYLSRIILSDFKNIESADLSFSPKINCITGGNGVGKTTLLDAVHYLSVTKSFLCSSDRYTCRYGCDEATVYGSYPSDDHTEQISISIKRDGGKVVRKDSKPYKRISDHIGRVPVVLVSPSDSALIHDGGEERRRFLNLMLSQIDPEYLRRSMNYNRLLKQRNSLLKQESVNELLLESFSAPLYPEAEYIHGKRNEAVKRLSEYASDYYSLISEEKESITMEYHSDLNEGSAEALFREYRGRDLALRYTTVGVQRDDVIFGMDGHSLRRSASQGQQKTFIVALKMAQYRIMREAWGEPPILLLDDLFDKLDIGRIRSLLDLVLREEFGQIFITDTDRKRVRQVVELYTDAGKYYEMEGGRFHEMEGERNA